MILKLTQRLLFHKLMIIGKNGSGDSPDSQ